MDHTNNIKNHVALVKLEKRVTCPYNPSHLIDPGRIQIHLHKCKKSHPGIQLSVCPFNATHHVQNLTAHIKECKDKCLVEKAAFWRQNPEMLQSTSQSQASSQIDSLDSFNLSTGEDWDKEIESAVSFNPERSVLFKEVSRIPPPGLGKATRKRWRRVEEERLNRLKTGESIEDLAFPTAMGEEVTIHELIHGPNASYETEEKKPVSTTRKDTKSTPQLPPIAESVVRSEVPLRRPNTQSRIAADIFGEKVPKPERENSIFDGGAGNPGRPGTGLVNREGRRPNLKQLLEAVEAQLASSNVNGEVTVDQGGNEGASLMDNNLCPTRDMTVARRMIIASFSRKV